MKFTKYTVLLLICLFVPLMNSFAQDEQIDSLNFEVTPVQEEKPPYFAIGGGYAGTFFFNKMDAINSHFKTLGFNIPELPSNTYISGAQGFTAIGLIKNLRIGFFGYSGSSKAESGTDTVIGTELTTSFTGFSLDYGFLPFKHLAILPGINFGWSGMTIESYKRTKDFDFANFPLKNDVNYLHRADGTFYFLQPGLNIEYAVTPFLMARINVNYSLSFSPTWKYNRNSTLTNVDKKMKTEGLGLQFGIFVGLFNY